MADAFNQEADKARKAAAFASHEFGFLGFAFDLPTLDENSSAITAFASHCPELGGQDQPLQESHVVYAIARRGAGGEVVIDVVGTMHRPEWEDRFDVGYGDEDAEDGKGEALGDDRPTSPPPAANRPTPVVPPAPVPPTAPQPRGVWAFLRRLFGG